MKLQKLATKIEGIIREEAMPHIELYVEETTDKLLEEAELPEGLRLRGRIMSSLKILENFREEARAQIEGIIRAKLADAISPANTEEPLPIVEPLVEPIEDEPEPEPEPKPRTRLCERAIADIIDRLPSESIEKIQSLSDQGKEIDEIATEVKLVPEIIEQAITSSAAEKVERNRRFAKKLWKQGYTSEYISSRVKLPREEILEIGKGVGATPTKMAVSLIETYKNLDTEEISRRIHIRPEVIECLRQKQQS